MLLDSGGSAVQLVLADVLEVLAGDEVLRATLDAWITANQSLAEAARLLHVVPNTVAYRLDQLKAKVGLDPRTTDGLITLTLARRLT